jgi:hypothetical protein
LFQHAGNLLALLSIATFTPSNQSCRKNAVFVPKTRGRQSPKLGLFSYQPPVKTPIAPDAIGAFL